MWIFVPRLNSTHIKAGVIILETLFKGLEAWCYSFCLFWNLYVHSSHSFSTLIRCYSFCLFWNLYSTFITFIQYTYSPRFIIATDSIYWEFQDADILELSSKDYVVFGTIASHPLSCLSHLLPIFLWVEKGGRRDLWPCQHARYICHPTRMRHPDYVMHTPIPRVWSSSRNDAAYQRESAPLQEVETKAKLVVSKLTKWCCLSKKIYSTTGGRDQGEVSCQ
jgi:hypothetical protein